MPGMLDYWRYRRDEINLRRQRQHGTEDLPQLSERYSVWRRIREAARVEWRDGRRMARAVEDPNRRVTTRVTGPSARRDRDVPKGGPRNIRRALALHAELEDRTPHLQEGGES